MSGNFSETSIARNGCLFMAKVNYDSLIMNAGQYSLMRSVAASWVDRGCSNLCLWQRFLKGPGEFNGTLRVELIRQHETHCKILSMF